MTDLLYKDEVYKIVGAAFEVYNELGNGFLEAVYQEALEIEFDLQNIKFIPQNELSINYKSKKLKQRYKPDFIVFDKIIVEIKSIKKLTENDIAQIIHYLKATGIKLGLLINFGNANKLEWERIILEKNIRVDSRD
ncbi:MAG TPA: GxxExxY protein [bacterium]|nr:GxxExxY protein [bacterium]HPN32411.1 GxxExxY protein [bacterium]